jgi:hypothetical protein
LGKEYKLSVIKWVSSGDVITVWWLLLILYCILEIS